MCLTLLQHFRKGIDRPKGVLDHPHISVERLHGVHDVGQAAKRHAGRVDIFLCVHVHVGESRIKGPTTLPPK